MADRRAAINLRSPREIDLMRPAGRVVWEAHQAVAERIGPGVTTRELDQAVEAVFARHGAEPLFKGVPGVVPFPAATCISINEEVVHGIPGDRLLQEGDIVSVDTGCRLQGWCGDAAVTHAVGPVSAPIQALLQTTQESLHLAIQLLARCQWWSEVARAMEQCIHGAGFSVIQAFCGHGIGRQLHEPPQVPNSYKPEPQYDFKISPGLVLAIEPMVSLGRPEVICLADHWTQVTRDGSWAAHFEHTVAITAQGPEILTLHPGEVLA